MSKELKALENLYEYLIDEYDVRGMEDIDKNKNVIENALKDYEWLKSIIPVDAMFMWNLSSDDKLRLLKIMGVEYE